MKQLALILPVYNEEEIIENVIQKWSVTFESLNIDYEIFAYNDGSLDKSSEILNKIAQKNEKLIVINKNNTGHGATILQGYRECCESFEWIFQADSDNEIDTAEFTQLWENRANYDFLTGKRIYEKRALSRKIVSSVARNLVQILCGKGVSDVNCPYRLMKTEKFKELFKKIPHDTFSPNVIISSFVNKNKLAFFELPVTWQKRTTGSVSIKKIKLFKASIKAFWQTVDFVLKKLSRI